MAPFLVDWRKLWRGDALGVVQPTTTAEVAALLRWAHETATPVTPQGGNTGLSGGSVPGPGDAGLVLSLARMNRIRAVDPVNNTITVDAGCLLAKVQGEAEAAGRFFPLSLAAEGSCTIGGNLATNAGGTGVLRYGNARDLCLGLEVVTARGEIWDGLRGLRKDNTGYDLRDLFIGSEGTLGVITGAVLKLHPAPAARVAAFAAVATPHQALGLLQLAQNRLGPALTGFELISSLCLQLVLRHVPGARPALEAEAPWCVLIEVTDLLDEARALDALEDVLGRALEDGLVSDAAIAASIAQTKAFWALRENVSEAQGAEGKTVKHDVSVPISSIGGFLDGALAALARLHPDVRPVVFGHLGDGNIHFNVSPAAGDAGESLLARQGPINRIVHDLVAAHGGSISAEHGLGVLRRDEAEHYKTPIEMGLMRAIKRALDPIGIMNPGKLLRLEPPARP
ncbi:hydroxyacid dehydrogenase [Phenylobacterium hankyongense]|uniref:Hydroxyacid dehydrogenase n=2 Tax=Phenylobacterium hankyongense TaxID=1813876 RepID=A0A328B6U5_9CAUL|nr:hydroxyacid dehydrogenase [Phenylobacterium hankyongense]